MDLVNQHQVALDHLSLLLFPGWRENGNTFADMCVRQAFKR